MIGIVKIFLRVDGGGNIKIDTITVSPLFVQNNLDNRVKFFDIDVLGSFDSGTTSSVVGTEGLDILRHLDFTISSASI